MPVYFASSWHRDCFISFLLQIALQAKNKYNILIDCQPSLGMLTVNALAAANRVIIPVQAEYLPAKGLEQLLQTVNKVKRQINPKLQIDGILLTMVDNRTNFAKEIAALLRETYGSKIKVFGTEIPHSVRAKEISAEGKSIFAHDPNGKVAESYKNLTKEVIKLEKQREKSRTGSILTLLVHTLVVHADLRKFLPPCSIPACRHTLLVPFLILAFGNLNDHAILHIGVNDPVIDKIAFLCVRVGGILGHNVLPFRSADHFQFFCAVELGFIDQIREVHFYHLLNFLKSIQEAFTGILTGSSAIRWFS